MIGLDGAPPALLFRWARRGLLPNIAGLMAKGAYGPLRSTLPFSTCPAWTSSITGVDIEKHGIYDFFLRADLRKKRIVFANSRARRARAIWELLDEVDRSTVVLNLPVTYPPEEVNGAMVSGFLTPSMKSDFTYPKGLKSELLEMGYRIDIGNTLLDMVLLFEKDPLGFLRAVSRLVKGRLRAAEYLMKSFDWDLFIVVFVALDRVNHLFWKYIDPKHKDFDRRMAKALLPHIMKCYSDVDRAVGELVRLAGPETDILIYSDHGFKALNRFMFVNNLLRAKGLLSLREGGVKISRLMPTHDLYMSMRQRIPLTKAIHTLLPSPVKRKIGYLMRPSSEMLSFFDIDPDSTMAYQLGQLIHFNERLSADELLTIVRAVLGALEEVYDQAMIRGLIRKLPHGATTQLLIVLDNEGDIAPKHLIPADGRLFQDYGPTNVPSLMWCGDHSLYGTLVMAGPHVKPIGRLEGGKIMDMAPTALSLLGLDIPPYMDGVPLT